MDRNELITALRSVLALVADVPYRLVGTGAALLQGVEIRTGDVDILVARRGDVDRFATAIGATPQWLPEARQYFARAPAGGVEIEVSTVEVATGSDMFECIGRGPWEHFAEVDIGGHRVPAVALELRLATELVRDRPDRYRALLAHMRSHGADAELAERAMRDRDVRADLRERALDELRMGGEVTPRPF